MEELESLDKKALENQYVNSYKYTTSQRVVGGILAFILLCTIIALCCVIFMRVLGYFAG